MRVESAQLLLGKFCARFKELKLGLPPSFFIFHQKLPMIFATLIPFAFLAGNVVTEIMVALVVVGFLVQLFLTKKFDFLQETWLRILGLFIGYLLIRSLFQEGTWNAIRLVVHQTEFIIFALALCYWVLETHETQQRLLFSLAIVLLFTIFDTWIQFRYGTDLLGWPSNNGRLTGPFQYMRVGGFIAFLIFPLLAVLFDQFWRDYPGIISNMAVVFVLSVVGLVLLLTGERVTWIYFALAYMLMFFLWRRHRGPLFKITLFFSSMLLVALCAFIVVHRQSPESVKFITDSKIYAQLHQRIMGESMTMLEQGEQGHYRQIWSRAYTMFTYAPLFGVGIHQFKMRCPDILYGPNDKLLDRCAEYAHHYYLEFLSETGLVGFALIVPVFILLLLKIWRTRDQWGEVPLLFGLFIAYFISIWPLAPFRGFFQNWRAVMFWFVVGWMLAAIRTYKGGHHEKLRLYK